MMRLIWKEGRSLAGVRGQSNLYHNERRKIRKSSEVPVTFFFCGGWTKGNGKRIEGRNGIAQQDGINYRKSIWEV